MMSGMDTDRSTSYDVHVLACAECPRVSTITARGWKAYWTHDEDEHEHPLLTFLCPACAPS